jgi:type I restriction enzyme S subunit
VLALKRLHEVLVPIPPLDEQKRILTQIESISELIDEAQELRRASDDHARSLLVAMAHRADLDEKAKLTGGWRKVRLSEVMRLSIDLHDVATDRVYQNLGIYSFAKGLFRKPPIDGALTSAHALQRVRQGQFIYSRLFAFEGAYGMVTSEFDGLYTSSEYPTFECDPKSIRAEFLVAYTFPPPTCGGT